MNRDTAVASIARALGNRTDQNDNIVAEMQVQQVRLEQDTRLNPWWLESEMSTASTTASEERVAVPANWTAQYELGGMWIYDPATGVGDETELYKYDIDDLKRTYGNTEGRPKGYARTGLYYRFVPIPDQVYTLRQLYYKKDTVLSSNVSNGWLTYAPELLIARTGMIMAQNLQNKTAYQIFQSREGTAYNELERACVSKEVRGAELCMGGE